MVVGLNQSTVKLSKSFPQRVELHPQKEKNLQTQPVTLLIQLTSEREKNLVSELHRMVTLIKGVWRELSWKARRNTGYGLLDQANGRMEAT